MAKQLVNLGTPNNNDGDSLYAGGVKINANFNEIYAAFGTGSTILVDVATGQAIGNSIIYSGAAGKYVAVSSTSLRTMGANGATLIYLTNDAGTAGVDNELNGLANTEYHIINGRLMMTLRARTTGTTSATRGEIHYGLGMALNTSMSIYTTGVVVRGFNALEVLSNANAGADTNQYTTLLNFSANGAVLHGAPVLSSNALKAITDNSAALAHTGFVQSLVSSVQTSISITGNLGLTGGGDLSSSRTIGVNPLFQPHFCDGFLYRVTSTSVIVSPGAAVHYSFGTAGETPVSLTTSIAIVSISSVMTKSWTTSGTWTAGNGGRIIADSTAVAASTWYYLYLIANTTTGAADYLVSPSRTIPGVSNVPSGYAIVRRLGVFRTATSGSPPLPLPFTTRRVSDNVIEFNWGKLSGAGAVSNITANNGIHRAAASTLAVNTQAAAGTATTDNFASTTLNSLPPLPGVTVNLAVSMRNSADDPPARIHLYGQAWTSITATALVGPPTTIVNGIAVDGSGAQVTSTVVTQLCASPDTDIVPETTLAGAAFPAAGQILRHYAACTDGTAAPVAMSHLSFEVLGFHLAR